MGVLGTGSGLVIARFEALQGVFHQVHLVLPVVAYFGLDVLPFPFLQFKFFVYIQGVSKMLCMLPTLQ